MSEFQFYEFRTIDKPLSEKDRKEIGRWSSRTTPTSNSAVFTYHYSDFPKDKKKVVEKYFDAMFYFANWGSKRLILKFPKELVDIEQIQQYCFEFDDELILNETENYVIIDFVFSEEGNSGWFDGEGCLTSLISLRNDILEGDFRCLYLAWLYAMISYKEWDDFDDEIIEPTIPPGLQNLNAALKSFIELLGIDEDILYVAVEKSKVKISKQATEIENFIEKLSEKEKVDFLKRMLKGERLLDIKLANRLKKFSDDLEVEQNELHRRTIGDIFQKADLIRQKRKLEEKRKRQAAHLKKMQKLELQEDTLWKTVYQNISEKKPKSYDEAIKVLKNLNELSQYKNNLMEFYPKVEQIRNENKRLTSLQNKLTKSGLIKKK